MLEKDHPSQDVPRLKTIPVTVLITTANSPPQGMPYLEMVDPVMRTIAAKAALYFWVAQGVEQIVLADATETNLLNAQEEADLDRSETRIEQINYKQDSEAITRKGKGYAEGKLIEYAINNSELLARDEYFFKCTGKAYVRNFPVLAGAVKASNITNLFWRFIDDSSLSRFGVDCRFYYTSKRFARDHLLRAYLESNDVNGVFCEDLIRDVVNTNLQVGRSVRPLLAGYAGSTGEPYYDPSLGVLDNEFPCWVSKR
jgi:hypothetical protein